jgi:hypothetical protein
MISNKKKKLKEDEDDDFEMGEFRGKYIMFDRLFFEVDKAVSSKHLRREMLRFFIFIITFLPFVIMNNSVSQSFAAENTMRETFQKALFRTSTDTLISFDEIDSLDNFWRWADLVLLENLYSNKATATGPHAVKEFNELLWGVRFRQNRVKRVDDCDVPSVIKSTGIVDLSKCASDFSLQTMDVAPYGGLLKPPSNVSVYTWKPKAETGDYDEESRSDVGGVVFDGSGHLYDLGLNRTVAKERIKWLSCEPNAVNEDMLNPTACVPFADEFSRSIFVSFTTINVNYDLLVRSEFRIEMSVSGWVATETNFYGGQLVQRQSAKQDFLVVLDIILSCIIVFDTIQFLWSLRARGLNNISLWTLLDGCMYFVFCVHVYDSIRRSVFLDDQIQLVNAMKAADTFYSTSKLLIWYRTMQQLYAMNTILLILRTFKYLNLASGLASVFRTLQMAFKDMIYFFVLFFLMFFGFVFSGYVLFGPRSSDFKTLADSSVTLLRMAIADIEYNKFIEGDPASAPLFFVIFTVLFYFIMTNIFLSIILDVWHKEKERLDREYAMQENIDIMHGWRRVLLDYIKYFADPRTYSRCFRKLKQPKNLPGLCIREICGDLSSMDVDEVKERLKLWRNKRQNKDIVFVHFALILKALEGGLLNHREVSDEQVRNVMALCIPPIDTKILYVYDREQMEGKLAALTEGLEESPSMDEYAAKNVSLTSMKRLIQAMGMVHVNQSKFWGKITHSLEGVQMQSVSMQRKMDTLQNRMDQLVPKLGSAYGGRGLDDRNN